MEKYQIIVFKFEYTNSFICYWPIYFEISSNNDFGQIEKETVSEFIKELLTIPGIDNVQVIHNKLADLIECEKTVNSILNKVPQRDDVQIKCLNTQIRSELKEFNENEYNNFRYQKISILNQKFSVRVRTEKNNTLLDDLELPILVIHI